MNDKPETAETTDALLLKFATALGDALFDFSIAIGRAVDIIRPDLAPSVSRDLSPHESIPVVEESYTPTPDLLARLRHSLSCPNHNIDAGGNCRACGYNSDVARASEDYDYGDVPLIPSCAAIGYNGYACGRDECKTCNP